MSDQRDSAANERDETANKRDAAATGREHNTSTALVWLFSALVVIGIALCLLIGQVMRRLDEGNKVDERQARATEDLVVATGKLNDKLDETARVLSYGRYERQKFQAEERALTCLDLQDGDTGTTDVQIAECAKDYIEVPPEPEGYPG